MHEVRILPSGRRDLDALDPPIFRRIVKHNSSLAEHPRPPGAIKLTGEEGYRIRVGDYRILYRVDDAARIVFVYRVKHRREAYR